MAEHYGQEEMRQMRQYKKECLTLEEIIFIYILKCINNIFL
ncbi:unnamed protein product [marine sediment metagenome]|uniref:Uncharacterized protein n=1 Tax=marine sediment metagenome TaxID=412755 RepID=X1IG18_9ZZZZ